MNNSNSKNLKIFIFIIVALLISVSFYYLWPHRLPIGEYRQIYRLVPEKISQSAMIPISLPAGVDKNFAKNNIQFEPELAGSWVKEKQAFLPFVSSVYADSNELEIVYFKPEEKLKIDHYYNVILITKDKKTIMSDFLAVDDPEVLAIFPHAGSETSEFSEITVAFNRPIVPLSTLSEMKDQDVPVEITPETKGTWKWITTRNLQFVPEERLKRASTYTVKIKPGFTSVDGLSVKEKTVQFTTRHLRLNYTTKGSINYHQPVRVSFNQPVDLEKTLPHIKLRNIRTGEKIPFIVEYQGGQETMKSTTESGPRGLLIQFLPHLSTASLTASNQDQEEVNKSVLLIYNLKDEFSREKLWDFETSYELIIQKAYPIEGDIAINYPVFNQVTVRPFIKQVVSLSDRTNQTRPDFFDPEGKVAIRFEEEIDLNRTLITAPYLDKIEYGRNEKEIYIFFRSEKIGKKETIPITIKKLRTKDGLEVIGQSVTKTVTSYPQLELLKTVPAQSQINADLKKLILCTNTPLLTIDKDNWAEHISANKDFEMNYWGRSSYISRTGSTCRPGEFQTRISYGLMPLEKYDFNLLIEDVFGQQHEKALSFTTGKMPSGQISLFSYQSTYSVALPERTTFLYGARNIDYVNLNICKLPAQRILPYLQQRIGGAVSFTSISGCLETVNVNIPLPKRYWIQNHLTVDISDYFANPLGHYVITLSHPNYKSKIYDSTIRDYKEVNRYHHSYLSVTNLSVAEKKISPRSGLLSQHEKELENLYWVNELESLAPVGGATVSLYRGKSFSFAGQFLTNERGITTTPIVSDLLGVIVSHGQDSAVLLSRNSQLNYAPSVTSAENIYLYTDKPIYQPTQEVFIKGIHRIGYDGAYEIMEKKEIKVTARDSRGNEIFSEKVYLSEFGTFETSFLLDKEAPLGRYRICANRCIYVDVQEYVAAPFEVKISSDKEEYISKEEVTLEVSADYYFGVPLESAAVSYTLSSQNYFFDKYRDRYFNFGFYSYYEWPFYYNDKFILAGKTDLKNGKAEIKYRADLEEASSGRIIIADVVVQNPEGETISGQFSFIVHPAEKYLGISADKRFLAKEEPTLLRIKSVDTEGQEVSAQDVEVKITKIEWQYVERQETDGGFYKKWERKETEVEKMQFDTDKRGNHQKQIEFADEGEYLLEASLTDQHGNLVKASSSIYVYGKRRTNIRFPGGTGLDLEVLERNLNVGDTAEIVIKSPYDKAVALIAIERGKIFDYEIRKIEGSINKFSFTIEEEYAPNVFVSVLLQSPDPEVRFASEKFNVDAGQYGLNIEIKPAKEVYLPGEKAKVDIKITDHKDRPVEAEFSLAVVDLSILALKGNPKKVPLTFFYSGFPLAVATSSNIKNILLEKKLPETKGGGGGDGFESGLETKIRGDFRELAFWEAAVKTDKSGKATISFELPDNITRWQTEAVGITKDTKIGAGYAEFTARKELMLTPLRPRFVVPGDKMMIGAGVFNETDQDQKIEVSFTSDSLEVTGKDLKTATLKAETSQTFYFEVTVPANQADGLHSFILAAKTPTHQDTVLQSIPITPSNVYETVATAYSTSQKVVREYVFLPENILKDRGELSVSYSATLAVFMSDALNYLVGYPYGCTEQISSRLNALAILKKGLNIPNIETIFQPPVIIHEGGEISLDELVEIGTAKLYTHQKRDGGFAVWPGGDSSFYATLYVVGALQNLKEAGYKINESSLNEGASFLFNQVTKNRYVYQNNNNVVMAAYHLLALPQYENNETLILAVKKIVQNKKLLEKELSNTTLAQIAVIAARSFDQESKKFVFETIDNRLQIDARGAFLPSNQNFLWYNFESHTKNTALYLKAISISQEEHPFADQILRWLINSKTRDGSWGTTNNTLAAIDAFTEYISWKRETESNFTLNISVNDIKKDGFTFEPENIFEQKKTVIPVQDLEFNAMNKITFAKENHNRLENKFFYDMALRYHLPLEQSPPKDEGFSVTRAYYRLDDKANETPVTTAKVGEVIRVHLQVTVPVIRRHAVVEDFIPAGFEIINLDLATAQKSLRLQEKELTNRELRPTYQELRNDRAFLYKESLSAGVYEFDYFVRALIPGKFTHLPASAFEMYTPENFGRTAPSYFEISAE